MREDHSVMTIALILAAGSGERFGAGRPKALVELAGRPLVRWSVDTLLEVAEIERIVVALPRGTEAPAGVIGVEGGAVRSESVRRALAAADVDAARDDDLVLVHDAARPLVTVALAQATIRALEADGSIDGAIAAAPMTDTVKRVGDDGVVRETLDRSELWAVQTPQVFRRGRPRTGLGCPRRGARAGHRRRLADRTRGRPGWGRGVLAREPEGDHAARPRRRGDAPGLAAWLNRL